MRRAIWVSSVLLVLIAAVFQAGQARQYSRTGQAQVIPENLGKQRKESPSILNARKLASKALSGDVSGFSEFQRHILRNGYAGLIIESCDMARSLAKAGRTDEALQLLAPMVTPRVAIPSSRKVKSAADFRDRSTVLWPAVVAYEDILRSRKVDSDTSVRKFRESLRDASFGDWSVSEMESQGLKIDESFAYARGRWFFSLGDLSRAEAELRIAIKNNPPCIQPYALYDGLLRQTKRESEVQPMYERWYQRGTPETRAYIKKWYFLDYARLEKTAGHKR